MAFELNDFVPKGTGALDFLEGAGDFLKDTVLSPQTLELAGKYLDYRDASKRRDLQEDLAKAEARAVQARLAAQAKAYSEYPALAFAPPGYGVGTADPSLQAYLAGSSGSPSTPAVPTAGIGSDLGEGGGGLLWILLLVFGLSTLGDS